MNVLIIVIVAAVVVILFLAGFKVVRPTHRALVERLGKYHHFANPGLHWIIPFIDFTFVRVSHPDSLDRFLNCI